MEMFNNDIQRGLRTEAEKDVTQSHPETPKTFLSNGSNVHAVQVCTGVHHGFLVKLWHSYAVLQDVYLPRCSIEDRLSEGNAERIESYTRSSCSHMKLEGSITDGFPRNSPSKAEFMLDVTSASLSWHLYYSTALICSELLCHSDDHSLPSTYKLFYRWHAEGTSGESNALVVYGVQHYKCWRPCQAIHHASILNYWSYYGVIYLQQGIFVRSPWPVRYNFEYVWRFQAFLLV